MPAPAPEPEVVETVTHWEGTVEIPGQGMDFYVAVDRVGEKWSGRLTIPAQGVVDQPLDDVEAEGETVSFGLAAAGATWTRKADGSCSFEQLGQSIPCTMDPIDAADVLEVVSELRPQTPRPPFPYASEEVVVNAGVELAGTLTLPEGAGPFPAVVLLSGSGAQDRDSTMLGHRPFAVLSDRLTREGVAVLRLDDRGVGGSGGEPLGGSLQEMTDDALAALRFLAARKEIDGERTGLLGHSEGGTIAVMAAAQAPEVKFVISLAGAFAPPREVMSAQRAALQKAQGLPPAFSKLNERLVTRLLEVVESTSDDEGARKAIDAAIREIWATLSDDEKQMLGDLELFVGTQQQMMANSWFRSFVKADPGKALPKVTVPVLALNGELDLQVLADQNLKALRKGLKKAKNKQLKVVRLPGLNHLLQPATTGALTEYPAIKVTMDEAALAAVVDWSRETLGAKTPG